MRIKDTGVRPPSTGEDLAESADTVGISYEALLQRILNLGRSYRAAWRG